MTDYALETIGVSVTAPGAAGAAMAPVAGDSLRIRDSAEANLLDVLTSMQVQGLVRITSPLIHDNLVGISMATAAGGAAATVQTRNVLSLPVAQRLTPQDTLQMFAQGSAVAGDVELTALQIHYRQLAGICANLIDPAELMARAEDVFSPRVTITGTGAGWTGEIAITALDDQLKANREYAWVGISNVGAFPQLLMLGIVSPDWGNLRIGCPLYGNLLSQERYFIKLSQHMGTPLIPVFNASQKDNILLRVLGNENAVVLNASLFLVLLRDRPVRGKK